LPCCSLSDHCFIGFIVCCSNFTCCSIAGYNENAQRHRQLSHGSIKPTQLN
jgi:hypothetical protein